MEYVTIKEFSEQVGVSVQAVYQRLNKDLKPFVKVVDGKKMLSIKAKDLYSIKKDESELLNTLNATLNVLTEQLKEKDKQISELNKRLSEAMELNRNNQILISKQQNLQLREPETINQETNQEKEETKKERKSVLTEIRRKLWKR